MGATGPQVGVFRGGGDKVDILFHAGKLTAQDIRVAIGHVNLPRADGGRVVPGSTAAAGGAGRDHMGNRTVATLIDSHICQPLGEEFLYIVVVGSGFDEDLCIPGPAQPFISLGTVGGYIQEIPALPPDHVGKQPVQQRVGAGNLPSAFQVGMNRDGGKLFRLRHAGKTVQPDIAKAKESQVRMVGLYTAFAGIAQFCLGTAVIFVVKITLFVQHLTVRNFYLIAFLRLYGKTDIPGDFLAEIHHRLASRCGKDSFGGYILFFPNIFTLLGDQILCPFFRTHHRPFIQSVESGVEGFSVIDFAEANLAFPHGPTLIGGNHRLAAIRPGQHKLCNQPGGQRGSSLPFFLRDPSGHRATVPAFADHYFQAVVCLQQIGHVVALVLVPILIGSPARSEYTIAHSLAVQAGFIYAHSGDEKLTFYNGPGFGKCLAEKRAYVLHRLRRCNPFCTPFHFFDHLSPALRGCLNFRFRRAVFGIA